MRSKEGKIWRRRLAKPGKTVELVGVENVRHLPRKDFSHLSPAGCSRLSFFLNERTNVINNPLVTRHGTLKHENLLIDRYRNHVAPYGTDLFAPPPLGRDEVSRVISLISKEKQKQKNKEKKRKRNAHPSFRDDKNLNREVSVRQKFFSH